MTSDPTALSSRAESLVVAACTAMVLMGCASPPPKARVDVLQPVASSAPLPKVRVNVLQPAGSADATLLKRVAVMQFGKRDRVDVTGDIEEVLAGVVVRDRRYYEVVERRQLNALLTEMKRGETGLLNPSTVASLGKMLGAAGVYTGEVTRAQSSDQRYTEARIICARRETKNYKKDNTYEAGCARWADAAVNCVRRTATFAFAVRLVKIETGEIVYSASHDGEAKSESCREPGAGETKSILPSEQLLMNAKETALRSFRRDIAPLESARAVELLGPGERTNSSEFIGRFNGALAFAQAGRMDRACEIWGDIATTVSDAPELTYDLGVCAEANGDLDAALRLYIRTDSLLKTPNQAVSVALERVRADLQARDKLRLQLRR